MTDIFNQAQQELQSEENARFDDNHERYAATALDPYYEAFCTARNYGDVPGDMTFAEFISQERASRAPEAPAKAPAKASNSDEIPF